MKIGDKVLIVEDNIPDLVGKIAIYGGIYKNQDYPFTVQLLEDSKYFILKAGDFVNVRLVMPLTPLLEALV